MKRPFFRHGLIGESDAMRALEEHVKLAAPTWETILLNGERGTGKERLAAAIHKLGPTRNGSLVTIDCAALHAATAESVLFGHERGAFTGAVNRRIGLLELGHQGSVFLDEIGLLPLELQGRLLRFLEERTVQRLGALKPSTIRTRIIAAANRDLARDAAEGRMLPDLYDRLNVIPLRVPPLRDRGNDILLLIEQFDRDVFNRLDDGARQALLDHSWPGNVREAASLCKRLRVFHPEGMIDSSAIARWLALAPAALTEREIARSA